MNFINFVPTFIAMQTSQNVLRQRNMGQNTQRNLNQNNKKNNNHKKAKG